jgi:hypothetical protein
LTEDESSTTPSVEERLERALGLLEECESVIMKYQEERGGQGDLLRKLQRLLD